MTENTQITISYLEWFKASTFYIVKIIKYFKQIIFKIVTEAMAR